MEKDFTEYNDLSKEQLIQKIEEMKVLINEIETYKNETELLTFPWIGNLGQWHWMVPTNEVVFNEKKVTNLGYDKEEIPKQVDFEFFTTKLHPDDYDRVMDNMRRHLMNLSDAYEVEYRIINKDGTYSWYYDRGKATNRDENGNAIVVSGIVFDISKNKNIENELKTANEKLKQLSITDELTGAYNRRFMSEKIKYEIQRSNRTKSNFSLIMLDIDNFKKINDEFGHNVGDKVLKKLVKIIMKRIRKTDILSRWGGEEFLILLPETSANNAYILAENIRIELNNTYTKGVGIVTASFGVSNYCENDTNEAIIKKADLAMYKSKQEGKNKVNIFV